ncbi:MAG: phosphoenolpyruvate--protein phosphotransferase [Clostridia bacterium]|nr:phosphoenolpyruvate--protein phosphotransferase [Clostridia bacterium]
MILYGTPVSEGYAVGKAFLYRPYTYSGKGGTFQKGREKEQLSLLFDAMERAQNELAALVASFPPEQQDKAKIFSAHLQMLSDEELLEEMELLITEDRLLPESAVQQAFSDFIALLSKVGDSAIAARTADLRDVQNRLLRCLANEPMCSLAALPEGVIIIAHDLLPSDTASMDRDHVLGIVTETGSPTSHSAILARSFGIPAVLGVENVTQRIKPASTLALNAVAGEVITEPDENTISDFQTKRRDFLRFQSEIARFTECEPLTKDGVRIDIGVNIGSAGDKIPAYSDFVGLFRTEFLYMDSDHLPTEEEQFLAYRTVLERSAGRPVTLRTLDIGGDKTLPYMELPKENNPFLGNRALRLCLSRPDIFNCQLRAALRASAYGTLWIMFPMVGSIDDIRRAKAALNRAKNELKSENIPFDENIKTGIMIEIPSIALISDLAAQEVDFASIGTNDLAQYTMAVDRMNPALNRYCQSLSPAMIRLLGTAITAFNAANKPISVCGELAGDPNAAAVLLGLGLRKFSMNAASIPKIKAALCKITTAEAKALATTAATARTETEIMQMIKAL